MGWLRSFRRRRRSNGYWKIERRAKTKKTLGAINMIVRQSHSGIRTDKEAAQGAESRDPPSVHRLGRLGGNRFGEGGIDRPGERLGIAVANRLPEPENLGKSEKLKRNIPIL